MQQEFSFGVNSAGAPDADGLMAWRAARKEEFRRLACELGLPLGHETEVWLRGGVRLRGRLLLAEELLITENATVRHLRFSVSNVYFPYSEMESCVRIGE